MTRRSHPAQSPKDGCSKLGAGGGVTDGRYELTGHKTDSIFRRYDIVSPGDLRDAARKLNVAQVKGRITLPAV